MYEEATDKEVLEILDKCGLLTYESQSALKETIENRQLNVDDTVLEQYLADIEVQIANFQFLGAIGFKWVKKSEGFVITRTRKAFWQDVIAIVVGLLFFLLGVYGVASSISIFVNNEDGTILTLAINLAMAGLTFLGINCLSGINRILDYSGFQVERIKDEVILTKRFDLKIEKIRGTAASIALIEENKTLYLSLGDVVILTSSAGNYKQEKTLEMLVEVFRKQH